MIQIEQQHMAAFDENGDNVAHGDCLSACIASIFELPLDEVPFFVESDSWWQDYQDFLSARCLCLERAWYTVDEDDPTKLSGWPGDRYWIATVKSPRGRARCSGCKGERVVSSTWDGDTRIEHVEPVPCPYCKATGLTAPLHAVVMFGRDIAWDPHPQREMGHLGFVQGEQFGVPDPARVALREADRC